MPDLKAETAQTSPSPTAPTERRADMDASQSAMPAPLSQTSQTSPPNPTPISSRTPPPSSRPPPRRLSPSPFARSQHERSLRIRTPSPPMELPSSPPSTAQSLFLRPSERHAESTYVAPTPGQIADASAAELRSFLEQSMAEVAHLGSQLTEARTASAHYRLQHNLLSIEAEEASKRMAVEFDMMRREMEVLQRMSLGNRNGPVRPGFPRPDEPPASSPLVLELQQQLQVVLDDNQLCRRRLRRAKKLIRHRDGEITSLQAELERLKTRIRENREHFDRLCSSGRFYSETVLTPRPPQQSAESQAGIVAQQQRTPKQAVSSRTSSYWSGPRTGGEDTFAALLLADQVLSQEDASAQSTPVHPRSSRQTQLGHTRGTQSLSSLPSTPTQFHTPRVTLNALPLASRSRDSSGKTKTVAHHQQQQRQDDPRRRGESTDSTISASDAEAMTNTPKITKKTAKKTTTTRTPTRKKRTATTTTTMTAAAAAAAAGGTPDVIQESEASQLARHMLRRSGSGAATTTSKSSTSAAQLKPLPGRTKKATSAITTTATTGSRMTAPGPGKDNSPGRAAEKKRDVEEQKDEEEDEGDGRASKRLKSAGAGAGGSGAVRNSPSGKKSGTVGLGLGLRG